MPRHLIESDLASVLSDVEITAPVTGQILVYNGTNWVNTNASIGITRSIIAISSATTAGDASMTDYVYLVSNTTTLTLPTAVSNTNLYTVKNVGTGIVTVNTTSSQTIDGSATSTLSSNQVRGYISDNSNWKLI